jgi:hypothetical protein
MLQVIGPVPSRGHITTHGEDNEKTDYLSPKREWDEPLKEKRCSNDAQPLQKSGTANRPEGAGKNMGEKSPSPGNGVGEYVMSHRETIMGRVAQFYNPTRCPQPKWKKTLLEDREVSTS